VKNAQRFFRYIWRVNAVIILLAAGTIMVGVAALLVAEFGDRTARNRAAESGIPVQAADSRAPLVLGRVSMVGGTEVMRADLFLNRKGLEFSSGGGGYGENRNILFIEPAHKAGHWLLPDNDHVIGDSYDVVDDTDRKAKRVIATAVLVKPPTGPPEITSGKLLLFDPPGRKVVEVANNVRDIHLVSLSSGEVTILYERDRRLVLSAFDPGSLDKRREQEIDVPQLK
jgi:hypothetical protein